MGQFTPHNVASSRPGPDHGSRGTPVVRPGHRGRTGALGAPGLWLVIAAQAVAAVRTGARGYVLKRIATTDLTATITAVLGGGTYVAPRCG